MVYFKQIGGGMRKRYLLAGVLSIVLLFSGCNPLAIKPWERKKLYAYYSNDANYVTVKIGRAHV